MYDLPKSVKLPDGNILKNHISYEGEADKRRITEEIKIIGGRYKAVSVLARGLRGKTDLHGKPYRPTTWLFTDVELP